MQPLAFPLDGFIEVAFLGQPHQICIADGVYAFDVHIVNATGAALRSSAPNPVNAAAVWAPRGVELGTLEGRRTPLAGGVSAHNSATFRIQTRAPRRTGLYTLYVTLVQEGVAWMQYYAGFSHASCAVRVVFSTPKEIELTRS